MTPSALPPVSPLPIVLTSKRYHLLELLGSGGMGHVYRAWDRLMGESVALKYVSHAPTQPGSSTSHQDVRLALAHEFQALASLRHPHIISVRDYGFSADHTPYFTMELLDAAQDLLTAGQGRSIMDKGELLQTLLQALAYIHRRGIVHRDLKPGNVLVQKDTLKVLDFGLSTVSGGRGFTSGTLAYMPPETFQGQAVTPSADLYAVGVMAYQLFTGEHPFPVSATELVTAVLFNEPNWHLENLPPALLPLLQSLLAKHPSDRPESAEMALHSLTEALQLPAPAETSAIREGFIQSAPFVGRTAELASLTHAIEEAMNGRSSAWLIGGESGVGKSRLVNECRTRALVKGCVVLNGRASTGDQPKSYALWHDICQRLVLLTDVTPHQAGVLLPLVPDLPRLLERAVTPAPVLSPQAAQIRLFSVMMELLKAASQHFPLLLLLEDLQWADENSLQFLHWLHRATRTQRDVQVQRGARVQQTDIPLIVLGNYRTDERPSLPSDLPFMTHLPLTRFQSTDIRQLAEAMLGKTGRQTHLLEFLQKETEGNAFFMVEVVRSLAETAGRLDDVGQMVLPERIFAGGVQDVVKWRLQKISADDYPLLEAAAVQGRVVDTAVLQFLFPAHNLDAWLTLCNNAAVLERSEEQWQFSHDKLREGVLHALEPNRLTEWHAQIGTAILACHADDLPSYYAALAEHFAQAGAAFTAQECLYTGLAGQQAAARFANETALLYINRALTLLPADHWAARYDLLVTRLGVYHLSGLHHEEHANDLAELDRLAALLGGDGSYLAEAALLRSQWDEWTGYFAEAATTAQKAVGMIVTNIADHITAHLGGDIDYTAVRAHDTAQLVKAHLCWGRALMRLSDYAPATQHFKQALESARTAGLLHLEADVLRALGLLNDYQGNFAEALELGYQAIARYQQLGDLHAEALARNNAAGLAHYLYRFEETRTEWYNALQMAQQMGDYRLEGMVRNNLGELALTENDFGLAERYLAQSLFLRRQTHHRYGEAMTIHNLGALALQTGQYEAALDYFQEALAKRREIGSRDSESETLTWLGLAYAWQGEMAQARQYHEEALALAQEVGAKAYIALASVHLGHVYLAAEAWAEAERYYQQGYEGYVALQQEPATLRPLAGLARAALGQNQPDRALGYIARLLDGPTDLPPCLGVEAVWPYWVGFQVCTALQDPRANTLLAIAVAHLQTSAETIADAGVREDYLTKIPTHAAIRQSLNDSI